MTSIFVLRRLHPILQNISFLVSAILDQLTVRLGTLVHVRRCTLLGTASQELD